MQNRKPVNVRAALIYMLPALLDMVLGLALFVGTVRAARLGGDALRAASVVAAWSLVYVGTCQLLGRWVTAANAGRLVVAGCVLLAAVLVLLAITDGFAVMLILIGCAGVAAALFFLPFQILMKDVDTAGGRTLAWSTGLYTFAWSAGLACGPFISGFLMQAGGAGSGGPGWRIAFLFGAAVCILLSIASAAGARKRGAAPAGPRPRDLGGTSGIYESMPDRVWLGWLGAGAGSAALSILRAVFPSRALGPLHISEAMLGTIFFTVGMTQALVGLAMIRSRLWMYRALPLAAFAAAGVAGLLCFGFGTRPAVFVAGGVLFGLFSGSFCFAMVFHALVHPQRAGRYVAVNESMVGLTGFVAPLLGGAMADAWGFPVSITATIVLVSGAAMMQVWVSGSARTRSAG